MRAKQAQALEMLALGASIEDTSQEIDITRRSIHNWLNNPEFLKALEKRKSEIIQLLNARMIGLNVKALEVLEDCMNSRNESIRLRASSFLASRLYESIEMGEMRDAIARLNEKVDQLASRR